MVVAMGSSPDNMPNLNELLEVIKALDDADYWGHGPPSSRRSRKSSKGDPVFDVLPGDFDQTYHSDRPPPPSSKSKAKAKDKSKSTSKSNPTSNSTVKVKLEIPVNFEA
jgi:hypothetical protein